MKKEEILKKIIEDKLKNFNQNENGLISTGIFGLPFETEESKMILVPVPWEATVSYHGGTANGPRAILEASHQIDLYDNLYYGGWKNGMAMQEISKDISERNIKTKEKVSQYIKKFRKGEVDDALKNEIDEECVNLNNYVKDITFNLIKNDKVVGIVGGDHSVPLGYMEALAEKYENYGILHIDAHADLRESYQGLTYSHASIFYNALKIKNISKLIQIGIRDFCEEEYEFINKNKNRIHLFTDYEIKKHLFKGGTLKKKYDEIIEKLPQNIYISFDIDGLLPYLNPNTGTPVVGGFSINEINFLLEEILNSGKKIIGFDLCEVAPGKDNEWDGNVGSRILYKLCLATLKSHNI